MSSMVINLTTYILSLRLRESVLDDILKDQGDPHVHPFTVHLSIYACGLVAHVVLLTALNPKIGFSLGFDSLGFRAGAKLGLLSRLVQRAHRFELPSRRR